MQLKKLQDFRFDQLSPRHIQLACLALVGVAEGMTLIFGTSFYPAFNQFMAGLLNGAALLFFALSILRPMSRTGRNTLALGFGFCCWYLFLQLTDFLHFRDTVFYGPRFIFSSFFCEYLLVLPFAMLADRDQKLVGLRLIGWPFLAGATVLTVLAAMQCMNIVPEFLADNFHWDGSRLGTIWNPNILGAIFMISIGFHLIFLFSTRRIWAKILLILSALAETCFMIFTNSRGVLIAFFFMLSMLLLLAVLKNPGKAKKSHRLLKIILTVGVILLLVLGILFVTVLHLQQFAATDADAADVVIREQSSRISFENLINFNGRLGGWIYALQQIFRSPRILLLGIRDITSFFRDAGFPLAHAHNAWIQTFLGMGLVGFLFAAALTWLTLKNSFLLLFRQKTSMLQKTVCLLSLSIFITQLLEPYIFFTEYPQNYINIVYLLCLSYEILWVHQGQETSVPTSPEQ